MWFVSNYQTLYNYSLKKETANYSREQDELTSH